MKEPFALDEPEMLARGVDAFKTEMLANLLERGSDAFAPLVFLKEGIYLRLPLCKAIHAKELYCKHLQYSTKSYSQVR